MKKFILPYRWYLDKTDDPKEMKIIFDWMQLQPNGTHWNITYASSHFLNSNCYGTNEIRSNFTLITFNEFYRYVILGIFPIKDEFKKEDLSYLILFLEKHNIQ